MRRPEDWKLAGVDDAADSVRITVVLSPSLPNDAAPPSATPPPRSAAARIPAARRGRRMRSTLGLYPRGLNPELRSVNPPLRGLMKKYGEEAPSPAAPTVSHVTYSPTTPSCRSLS